MADNRLKNLPRKETVDEKKKKIRERFNVIPTALGKPTMGIDGHVPENIRKCHSTKHCTFARHYSLTMHLAGLVYEFRISSTLVSHSEGFA